ncbi:hypothetical protein LE181_06545 [Streptomyces sp. SCA3-4]|nr:hypothetical protein [Streptomyces sichuanensis]
MRGLHVLTGQADGWGACGVRPGREPDWPAATIGRWNEPYSWTRVSTELSAGAPRCPARRH